MKRIPTLAIATIFLSFTGLATAQYEGGIEIPENVLEAIREHNERPPGTPNEVMVVLPTTDEKKQEPAGEEEAAADESEPDEVVASILEDGPEVDIAPGEPAPQGPEVRVQPLRDPGHPRISPDQVNISTPFAAKPLGSPAPGWKLVSSPQAPAFTRNVEVAPGTWLTLSIRPHVLVPDADGHAAFQIQEPGFAPALGYRQTTTVSSSLASTLDQLETDSRTLGKVLNELEQILISLPKSGN